MTALACRSASAEFPAQSCHYLSDHKDLGIHTETLTESAIPLIEKGVITGARKQINPNKIVLGFALGTREWYEYVDDNPIV